MAKPQQQQAPLVVSQWAGPLIFEPMDSNLGPGVAVSRAAVPEGWIYRIEEWALDPDGNRLRHLATTCAFVPRQS